LDYDFVLHIVNFVILYRTWRGKQGCKKRIQSSLTEEDKDHRRRENIEIDKRVKTSAKEGKKKYIENQAERIEAAPHRGDLETWVPFYKKSQVPELVLGPVIQLGAVL
jgi:hypothetical protein